MKLHYKKTGNGPPMFILHGLFGSSDNWLSIARELSDLYTIYLIDQRNHGQSPHSASFSYSDLAADIREFMEDFSIKSAVVLGHSMGGKTAMKLALDYPLKVTQLIVADIAPKYYAPRHGPIIEAMQSLSLDAISRRSEAEEILQTQINHLPTVRFLLKNLARDKEGSNFYWRLNIDGICSNLDAIGGAVEGYNAYDGPALFIRGGKSDYVSSSDLPDIKKLFPSAALKTIDGASHWLHVEEPRAFTLLVREFLESARK